MDRGNRVFWKVVFAGIFLAAAIGVWIVAWILHPSLLLPHEAVTGAIVFTVVAVIVIAILMGGALHDIITWRGPPRMPAAPVAPVQIEAS
jgi:hypothetical protein